VLPENQNKYESLLKLESWVLSLKDSDFVIQNGKRNDGVQAGNHKELLINIVSQIDKNIETGKYEKAAKDVEKRLIPKFDGCNGGNDENDLVISCELAINLYAKSTELLNALKNGADNNGKSAARAADASWDAYRQNLIAIIGEISAMLENAPDSYFKNPAGASQSALLDLIDQAKISLEEQDPDTAKEIIKSEFYPLIDGGNGGETQDDLINAIVYSTSEYDTAIRNVESIIQLMTLTMVSIAAAPQTMGIGETIKLTAVCNYNNSVDKDCSDQALWQTNGSSAATVAAGGFLTGANIGPVSVTAQVGSMTSAPVSIFVIYNGGFHDLFDDNSIDARLWTNVFKGTSSMTEENGNFRIQGGSYSFGQLIPIQYFKINQGEKLEILISLNADNSSGSYFVQGFGIYNQRTTGIAAGYSAGSSMAQPTIYLSSPRGYSAVSVPSGKGDYKIVYQNRQASLYFNGALIGTIEADLEGQRLTFFIYGSARNNSSIDAIFDNFMSNQTDPGEYRIDIANNTNPFGFNGTGSLTPGSKYTVDFYGDPNLTGIMGKLLDADTLQVIQGPFQMVQSGIPGKYSYSGTMPATSSSNIVFVASDDSFGAMAIYTRRIPTGQVSMARVASKVTQQKYIPSDFPAFLLPAELRSDK